MFFKLNLDPEAEESVVATVRRRCDLTDKIEALVLSYTGDDKLIAYDEDAMMQLPFSSIECITVLGGKTYAVDTRGKHLRLRQRLYELEQVLPANFIRINKSAIANEARLEKFTTTYSGAVNARFRCGYEEYVSRRCFADIKRRYQVK